MVNQKLEETTYKGQVVLKVVHILGRVAKILSLIMRENGRVQQVGADTWFVNRNGVQDPRLNLERLAWPPAPSTQVIYLLKRGRHLRQD